MSELVCYIDRAERGMLPVRLRLVSTRVDQTWTFPDVLADDRAALLRGLREAADWIAAQTKAQNRSSLGAVVLDSDGSHAGWVTTHSEEPESLAAALQQAAAPAAGEDDGTGLVEAPPQVALSPDMQIAGAVSVQPMVPIHPHPKHPGQAHQKRRVGVVVVPDATIRLLLDELDDRGIGVGRVVSIWHALTEAFGGGSVNRADRVIASPDGTVAHALVDPDDGRLVWVWSRENAPIASGAFRLAKGVPVTGEATPFVLTASDLARLAGEWLAWATQLGASPTRFRLMLPEWIWQDEQSLGTCVSAVWPGATADIMMEDDPVAHLLASFADALGDGTVESSGPVLEQLQHRPGKPHRAMYRWAAAAITIAAMGMGAAAYRIHDIAKVASTKANDSRTAWRTKAGGLSPEINEGIFASPAYDAKMIEDLRLALETRRRAVAPIAITPQKPVLRELETLSYVLGNPDYEVRKITLSPLSVTIDLVVPDTAAYEELINSLERIAGSSIAEWDQTPRAQGDGVRVTLNGTWASQTKPQPGGA